MKYKSLRFLIQINTALGWIVISGGILISAVWATLALEQTGTAYSIVLFMGGTAVSIILGIFIFAWGDIYQCFIDIETNTDSAAGSLRILRSKETRVHEQDHRSGERSNSDFTYMCAGCHTFQRSDVLNCVNCGSDNPHHPSNKSKATSESPSASRTRPTSVNQCVHCGTRIGSGDKFCSSCGYARP
jgi:hypothetical protein